MVKTVNFISCAKTLICSRNNVGEWYGLDSFGLSLKVSVGGI